MFPRTKAPSLRDASVGVQSEAGAGQAAQVLLRMQYRQMRHAGATLPDLADVEFRAYSQNGEDGILLYLFALLGTTSRRVVEICAGDGIECNASNLIVNHGWEGLLIDGDPEALKVGRAFYRRCKTTRFSPPTLAAAWITAENVNETIRANSYFGEIDLLSIDLDGMDYWIWRAIDAINPRVVVVEFNALLGPERALTLPYDPAFRLDLNDLPYRAGASLPAFVDLARHKGYRLVGVQSLGFNAFFVRTNLGTDVLPERSVADCFQRTERLRQFGPVWIDAMYRGGQRWEEV